MGGSHGAQSVKNRYFIKSKEHTQGGDIENENTKEHSEKNVFLYSHCKFQVHF